MVNKVIGSLFFIELIVALSIAVYWSSNNIPAHTITLSNDVLGFLKQCSRELNEFRLEIPSIPKIDYFETDDNWLLILNAFIGFVNGISGVINFVIMIINFLVQLLQFLFILIKNLFALIDNLKVQTQL